MDFHTKLIDCWNQYEEMYDFLREKGERIGVDKAQDYADDNLEGRSWVVYEGHIYELAGDIKSANYIHPWGSLAEWAAEPHNDFSMDYIYPAILKYCPVEQVPRYAATFLKA